MTEESSLQLSITFVMEILRYAQNDTQGMSASLAMRILRLLQAVNCIASSSHRGWCSPLRQFCQRQSQTIQYAFGYFMGVCSQDDT